MIANFLKSECHSKGIIIIIITVTIIIIIIACYHWAYY